MSDKRAHIDSWYLHPMFWGWVTTIAVIVLFCFILTTTVCGSFLIWDFGCQPKGKELLNSTTNEIGDTFAGFAGSLALIWLIVTATLQRQELQKQREEFEKQRGATEAMAKAMEKQVELLEVQGDIFADEQKQRSEERERLLIDQKLITFFARANDLKSGIDGWCFFESNGRVQHMVSWRQQFGFRYQPNEPDLFNISNVMYSIGNLCDYLAEASNRGKVSSRPDKNKFAEHIVEPLRRIVGGIEYLSTSEQVKIERLNIGELLQKFDSILNTKMYWTEDQEGATS